MVLWEGVHTYLLLTVEVAHEVGRLMLIEWSEDKLTRIMGIRGGGGWVNVVMWDGVCTYLPLTDEVAHEVGRLMLTEGSKGMSKLTRIIQALGVVGGVMWYKM